MYSCKDVSLRALSVAVSLDKMLVFSLGALAPSGKMTNYILEYFIKNGGNSKKDIDKAKLICYN